MLMNRLKNMLASLYTYIISLGNIIAQSIIYGLQIFICIGTGDIYDIKIIFINDNQYFNIDYLQEIKFNYIIRTIETN
jgi:hypothetical protein